MVLWAGRAVGQPTPTFLQQQRQVEEGIRRQIDRELPIEQKLQIDCGGWFSHYTLLFDDGVNSSRTLRRNDLRVWGSLVADEGVHQGYVRMKLSYADFNTGDSYDGRDNDWEGPNLDRGWYQLDFTKALERYAQTKLPFGLSARIGRDFIEFGTGYALSLTLDALVITGEVAGLEVKGLMGVTPSSTVNIDTDLPGMDGSERTFFGIETRYKGIERHEPFAYVLWNNDRTPYPFIPFQRYDYDSFYVGFGSTGELAERLRYSTEWVFESGESYGLYRVFKRNDIEAWAFDVEIEYLVDHPSDPRFALQYMFASGDPDRIYSPTNASGGNLWDRTDSSFVGFGYRDTGISFAPILSNIHVWRAAASFFPFHQTQWLEKLELGTEWFLYHKHHREAAVSDPLADQARGYLGWEMDYYANWRVTSDLSWTIRYGAFFPGTAFSDRTCRPFFLTGLTWSF
jgi:hypothetical protein